MQHNVLFFVAEKNKLHVATNSCQSLNVTYKAAAAVLLW